MLLSDKRTPLKKERKFSNGRLGEATLYTFYVFQKYA